MKRLLVLVALMAEDPHALGGIATSQQVMLTFSGQGKTVKALLLAYIPNQRQGSVVDRLYGLDGIAGSQMPAIHQPLMQHTGYHIRAGVHDVTDYDWQCYLDFCDKAFSIKRE